MRFFLLAVFYFTSVCIALAQTYSYDKDYAANIETSGVAITEQQKKEIRDDIIKWTEFYLSKKYKYNQSVLLTHVTTKDKKNFNFDCSGYIAAVYWSANIVVFDKQATFGAGGVKTIHATLSKYKKTYKNGTPNIGDIVMFDRTTSQTASLSHAGIVISVDDDATVTFAHSTTSRGLVLGYMNLKYPNVAQRDGKTINSYLRRDGGVSALASKCFNSFGTVLDVPSTQ